MAENAVPVTMLAMYTNVYGPPSVLVPKTVSTPTPHADQVLVQVHAASVHAGDWHLVRGTPHFIRLLFGGMFKPSIHIPGCDVSGTVVAVGSMVTEFAQGDAVFGDLSGGSFGAFAQYAATRVDALARKPENVTFQQAATAGVSALAALQAVRDAGDVQQGHQVLINGASGGVGSFAIQIAKHRGAHVTAVCRTSKMDVARQVGADTIIDYTEEDVTQKEVEYDVIIDAAAFRSMFDWMRIVKKGGKYVVVGGDTLRLVQAMMVGGVASMATGKKVVAVESKPVKKDLDEIAAMMERGHLLPIIDATFKLKDVANALERLEARKARGKIVIEVKMSD